MQTILRTILVSAALTVQLTACNESDSPVDTSDSDGAEGKGTGTLTLADGTVHEFVMTQCRTKTNAPSFFLIENGYDMSGRTDDGFRMTLIRAGTDDATTTALGDLEAEFDENDVNPQISYRFIEPDSTFVLDGNSLTGDLILFDWYSSSAIYGDEITGTLEIDCADSSE
ncbi:MAG: hypothetical protein ACI8S6_002777 [Myxococcota bacterium]|jgi:hypothetical protein